jgi:hypothetical protein
VSPRYRRLARVRDQETTALQGVRAAHDQPIEPTFATVRHRIKVTKGPGGPAGHGVQTDRVSARPLARQNAPNLVALVRVGASFVDGKLTGRPAKAPSSRRRPPERAEAATAAGGGGEHRARQVVTNPFGSDPGARRYARAPTTTTSL